MMSGLEQSCNIIQVLLIFISAVSTMSIVTSRELRPSDHGFLAYQDRSPSPEMQPFFNGQTPKETELPLAAKNASAEWWKSEAGKEKPSTTNSNNLKAILLLASLVCGVIGVVLLITSAFVLVFRYIKEKKSSKHHQQLAHQQQQEEESQR